MSNQILEALALFLNHNNQTAQREASTAVNINCGLRYLGYMDKSALNTYSMRYNKIKSENSCNEGAE